MKTYQKYLNERYNEQLDEGMKDLIMPIILGAALASNVFGKDVDVIQKKDQMINKASELVSKGVNSFQKGLQDIGQKGSTIQKGVQDYIDEVESNLKDVMEKVKDQKFEVVIDSYGLMSVPIRVDIKNKTIYLKSLEGLKDNPTFKSAIQKGILIGDNIKGLMKKPDIQTTKKPIDTSNII